jgi:predicted Ser/Thr protein kinase
VTCLDEELVVALLDGRASAEARAAIDSHVADCHSCRALLAAVVSSGHDTGAPGDGSARIRSPRAARTESVDSRTWQPGMMVNGRYVVVETVGSGGMGVVYRVRDVLRPGLDLALKTLSTSSLTPARAELLKAEFRIMAQLAHPNIARVYDFETIAGSSEHAFTMEYVNGVDLFTATQGASVDRVVDLAVETCRALAYLHSRGVVHADFKPQNVLVSPSGEVKVLDFGLSDVASTGRAGTPAYMAPELAYGSADAHTDLYAFGVTLFQLVCRRLPFTGVGVVDVLAAHARSPLAFPADMPSGDRLRPVIERLCAKEPARRFATAAGVIAALAEAMGRAYSLETDQTRRSYATSGHLIGRAEAMQELVAFSVQGIEGRRVDEAVLATVSGASGVGKSRLLRDLRRQLQLVGVPVLEAVCYEGGAGDLEPVRAVCDALTTLLRAHAPGAESSHTSALEWLRRADRVDEATHARRLRILANHVLDATQTVGFVLAIDDLQWAGTSTVDFLRLLCDRQTARRDAGAPVRLALVTCFRDDEATGRPVAELLEAVHGARRCSIVLRALGERETSELIGAMLGAGDLPEPFCARVSAETGGNPFFVEETVRALMDRGDVYLHAGRWAARASFDALQLPTTVAAALERRLSSLEPQPRTLVGWLAAYARPMPLAVLADASGLSLDAIFDAVRQLAARQMVVTVGPERIRLAHDRLREVAYARDEADSRRARHRAIAEALDRVAAEDADTVFERAHHRWHAGEAEPAVASCERAAALAESTFVVDVAIENQDRLRQLAAARADEPARRAATDRLLELLVVAGQYRRLFDLAGYELVHRSERLEQARLELLRGEALGGQGRVRAGLEHLRRATATLGGRVPASPRARRLFVALHYVRHVARLRLRPAALIREERLDVCERARREILARSYLLMSNLFQLAGDDEGFGVSFAGMNAAAGLGSTEVSRKLVQNMALGHHIMGRRGDAERAFREAQRVATSDVDRANVLVIAVLSRQITQQPIDLGQLPVGAHEDSILEAVEVLSLRSKALWANFARTVATILFCDYARAFRFRPEVARWADAMRGTIHGAYIQGELAVMARIDGQAERAERAYADFNGSDVTPFYRASVDAHVALVWALTGDVATALRCIRSVRERLATMSTRAVSSLWIPARTVAACIVLAEREATAPWLPSCLADAADRLARVGRRLPGNARFFLETARIALGGADVAALLRARELSHGAWVREQSLSGHPDACIVAALALRKSQHAEARAVAPALAEEALRLVATRFPAGYVGEIEALLSRSVGREA